MVVRIVRASLKVQYVGEAMTLQTSVLHVGVSDSVLSSDKRPVGSCLHVCLLTAVDQADSADARQLARDEASHRCIGTDNIVIYCMGITTLSCGIKYFHEEENAAKYSLGIIQ